MTKIKHSGTKAVVEVTEAQAAAILGRQNDAGGTWSKAATDAKLQPSQAKDGDK
jgi:hypothetical protein